MQLSAAQQQIGDAEAARRLTNDRAVAAETALEGIYSSRSWRMLQKLQRLRRCAAFFAKVPTAGDPPALRTGGLP